jgi:DNA repair protein RecO
MSVIELLEHVAQGEQRNDQLFALTLNVLRAIDTTAGNPTGIQFFFELHLTDLLGFKPEFHSCLSCGHALDAERIGTKGGELRFLSGGVLCAVCSEKRGSEGMVSPDALRILQRLQETEEPGSVTLMTLTAHQTEEVRNILRQYLQSHVGGLQRLKAQSIAASIAQTSSSEAHD